jgi:protein-S-isoprenylcysteine O-methyltransferase Ste14
MIIIGLYKIVLVVQSFGIVCMEWYSPKQGIQTLVTACLGTLGCSFEQHAWSIANVILVFALGYLIRSFTHRLN